MRWGLEVGRLGWGVVVCGQEVGGEEVSKLLVARSTAEAERLMVWMVTQTTLGARCSWSTLDEMLRRSEWSSSGIPVGMAWALRKTTASV